ncbi:MAG: hypothetical protein WC645_01330 [Candidatus Margulisiibacteriota bacterium]
MAEMVQRIGRAAKDLRADPELGNLVFFKTILAARVEMYIIGETKSRARKANDQAAYQAQCQAMREFADHLDTAIKEFPFTQDGFGLMLVEQLQIARDRARELNNINVDLILQTLTPKVVERIDQEEKSRIAAFKQSVARSGLSTFGGKVRITDDLRGDCLVTMRGYRKGAAGEMKRVIVERKTSIHKVLSMFDHLLAGEEAEECENSKYIADLREIGRDLTAQKEHLRRAYLGGEDRDKPRSFRDYSKIKARIEIWGALKLVEIDTPQARGLAGSLLDLAVEDYLRRNEAVAAMRELLTGVKNNTEILIGQVILSFVKYWAGRLAKNPRLTHEEVRRINRGLGKYLGTLFSDEVREPWFKQARSRITVALQMLARQVREGGDENQVTHDMARHILGIEFDFGSRHVDFRRPAEKKLAWLAFLRSQIKTYGPGIMPQDKPSPQTELGF